MTVLRKTHLWWDLLVAYLIEQIISSCWTYWPCSSVCQRCWMRRKKTSSCLTEKSAFLATLKRTAKCVCRLWCNSISTGPPVSRRRARRLLRWCKRRTKADRIGRGSHFSFSRDGFLYRAADVRKQEGRGRSGASERRTLAFTVFTRDKHTLYHRTVLSFALNNTVHMTPQLLILPTPPQACLCRKKKTILCIYKHSILCMADAVLVGAAALPVFSQTRPHSRDTITWTSLW